MLSDDLVYQYNLKFVPESWLDGTYTNILRLKPYLKQQRLVECYSRCKPACAYNEYQFHVAQVGAEEHTAPQIMPSDWSLCASTPI